MLEYKICIICNLITQIEIFMKTYFICLLSLCIVFKTVQIYGQTVDDFSDGDFTDNPSWHGTDSVFIVNDKYQLQTNGKVAGVAWLSVSYMPSDTLEWRFMISEKFAPSSKNFCDVFLGSDNSELVMAKQAYFLRLGEAGSDDVVDLMKLENGETSSICRGTDTFISSSFTAYFKIRRYPDGRWEVMVDKTGSGTYHLETQGVDNSFLPVGYFGLVATYTASNAKKFFFDDLYIGEPVMDTEPPALVSANVIDNHNVSLAFNECLDASSSLDVTNYLVSDFGYPDSVILCEDCSIICLSFGNAFQNDVLYELTIKKVSDVEGNTAFDLHCSFVIHRNTENDVVINEIMADPEPSVELHWEYLELYNTTVLPLNISGWTLVVGATEHKILNGIVIEPYNYVLLCHENAVEEMSQYGQCCGLSGFQIANGGTNVVLLDDNYNVISSVTFDISWYRDSDKAEGGWALEQIDPLHPCAGRENWQESHDKRGGTPCMLNSVDESNILEPRVDYVNVLYDNIVEVYFTHKMDGVTLSDTENYYIDELKTNPVSCLLLPAKNNYVELILEQPLETGMIYHLVLKNIVNCSGVPLSEDCVISFGMTQDVEPGDVLINEVLFNPVEPGVDYVELYNNSDKILDINRLRLGSVKMSFPNPPDTTLVELCSERRPLLPCEYLLLSQNGRIVGEQYNTGTDNFLDMKRFPSYNNDSGTVLLMASDGSMIDVMRYNDKMHYPLLAVTKGVSLERISFDKGSLDIDNWHSAAFNVNYGTPGYRNSVMAQDITETNVVTVEPEIFSPDGDGYDETAGIFLTVKDTGCTLKINILDSYGRHVRKLSDNVMISSEASFFWDGLDDDRNRVSPGIYIILTELFNMSGEVRRYKNAVVIATK